VNKVEATSDVTADGGLALDRLGEPIPVQVVPPPQKPPRRGLLGRLLSATEEENRQAILDALPAGVGGSLLDLGTHDGEFTTRVADHLRAEEVMGVELLSEHAAAARDRGIDVRVADLSEPIPFTSETVDVIHANQVIEHVRRTDRMVSEIHRVLRPGGIACISTNNLASLHNLASLAVGWQPMPVHVSDEVIVGNPINPENGEPHEDLGRTHLRLFTARALTELCEHHGLRTRAMRTVGYYPLPPRAARLATRIDPYHGAFLVALLEKPDSR
jgi:SAM-dependent methyltransferase